MRRALYLGIAAVLFSVGTWGSADAFTCSVIGSSGGNPGGEPISGCTGIVEGDTIVVNVDQTVNSDTLVATATILVTDISAGQVLLDVTISNAAGTTDGNRITSFGLGINPNATGGSIDDTSGTDDDQLTTFSQSNFPGFNLVEFCAASGNNCAGGGSGGLESGQSDSFQFTLTNGCVDGGSIALSQFAFKFQGGAASYEKPGVPETPDIPETPEVPELPELPEIPVSSPATLALLGGSLLALATATGVRGAIRNSRWSGRRK